MEREEVPVRSVARSIDVLLALADGGQSLGAISQRTALSKGTCHRLLASLAYRQLVLQDGSSGAYVLGPGCFRFVEAVTSGSTGVNAFTRPLLEALWSETQETVTLHVRIGGQRICVEELPSRQAVRYVAGVGSSAPIYVGSAGKVLLAFMEERERRRLLGSLRLEALTEQTVTDPAELEFELVRIRSAGWADSRGERVVGAVAISAPVLDADSQVIAAISVLGPDTRLGAKTTMDVARQTLIATAAACTDALSRRPESGID